VPSPYEHYDKPELQNTSRFICGMIKRFEGRPDEEALTNGLLLELGRMTYELSKREEQDERTGG